MSDPILELLAAPPNPTMSIDEDAVHAGGRRRVRRRALRRTAVGVAGVAGAAAFAFAAIGSNGDRGSTLPAGPPPAVSTIGRISVELLDGRYAVELVPGTSANQPLVAFHAVRGGERYQLATSSTMPGAVSMGTGSDAAGVMLGTAPADATAFLTITRDGSGTGGIQTDHEPLPGTDYQAVAIDFDDPSGPDGYLDTIWLDEKGAVRHANGTVIPSVLVPGTSERLFVARPLGQRMGAFIPSGGVHRLIRSSGLTVLGYGETLEAGTWTWRSAALLPQGATKVSFRWSPASQGSAVSLLPLPDGSGTIATATATATAPASSEGPSVLEVTWTDEGGTRHTDPVE